MISRIITLSLLIATAACTKADASDIPSPSPARIRSPLGFSFMPPPGKDWRENFGANKVEYLKKTDPAVVTFYAGALETTLPAPLTDPAMLAAFVKARKNEWGSDSRYTDITSSFLPDPQQPSCVRYRMTAHDHGAKNRGSHPYLLMWAAGRFCTHPNNPNAAVDLYYSTRHIPHYDARALNAEGHAFLDSLALDDAQAHQ
jgi:hypothetical protein